MPRHLVPVVGVDELVVVDAVGGVALHALDGGVAAVELEDVVDEGLAGRGELEGLGWVGGVVFGRVGLADFELLAWSGRVFGEVGHLGEVGGESTGRWWVGSECGAGECDACWENGRAGCSETGIDHGVWTSGKAREKNSGTLCMERAIEM